MSMPFDWIWRIPTELTWAWLVLAARKLNVQARRVKVWRGVFIEFLSA
jgi:hypothetical protein